jgi:hypothetical protein
MRDFYINEQIRGVMEYNYDNDLERLKAIHYALDYVLNNIEYNQETNDDIKTFNTLTTIDLQLSEIISNSEGANIWKN